MQNTKPPVLTEEQRRENTLKAIAARRKRAELKDKLHRSEISIADVLDQRKDPVIGRMKVEELLRCMPGVGGVKSLKIMDELNIAHSRRLYGLGSKQHQALIDYFEQTSDSPKQISDD